MMDLGFAYELLQNDFKTKSGTASLNVSHQIEINSTGSLTPDKSHTVNPN
jgi:hypothetical protein